MCKDNALCSIRFLSNMLRCHQERCGATEGEDDDDGDDGASASAETPEEEEEDEEA